VSPVSIEVTIRPLIGGDRELLRTATLTNVNWTGEQRFTHRDVDETPDLRHYTEFQQERGDLGLVAERDGLTVGVVWALFLAGADRGYGHVADDVPELSLCVWSGYRGQGVGGELLRRVLVEARQRGLPRLSLSVEVGNPAVHLYRAAGFRPVPEAAEGTMAVDL
jgi:ribosomal protein S18 acetylase RimI-like enzyme